MIQVLLVEDKRMSRDSITGYLNASERYRLAASTVNAGYLNASERYRLAASTVNAGFAEMLCMQNHIDLILMDVCTENNEDGIKAAAVIKRHFPQIKIVIVTGMTTIDLIERAKAAGADSFWYKESSSQELLEVMDRTMNGEHIYPDSTPVIKIGNMLSTEVTSAELEVLRLMVQGMTDAEIAAELHNSIHTVRYHVKNLFEKTGYTNRVALIADLINKEFIVPGL